MDKYIYDESNGLWYELQGDYYIPCLTLPTEKEYKPIGLWGQRHKRYLQEHKRTVYLADINEQVENMLCRLVKKMATKEKVTEQLKAENQMLWVQLMNNIHNRAMEVVIAKLFINKIIAVFLFLKQKHRLNDKNLITG